MFEKYFLILLCIFCTFFCAAASVFICYVAYYGIKELKEDFEIKKIQNSYKKLNIERFKK